ncbi:MAG: radical SAM protein [Anaerolineales bacterium]
MVYFRSDEQKAVADKFRVNSNEQRPSYLALFESGDLQRRAEQAVASLESCQVCPRNCEVDRLSGAIGVCRSGRHARVASYFTHRGEEDCLRGWRGSGTIFFTGCNLRCVFCQNSDISQSPDGIEVDAKGLAEIMLELQARGCHNINWVTPEHVVTQLLEAMPLAVEGGLQLPIVYNTSAYDSVHTLRLMDGIVDIYMPDFKIWNADKARTYLGVADYPEIARKAIREMHRQVGDLVVDKQGIARRGLLVRHLVMPEGIAGTGSISEFLAEEISRDTYINLMDQYYPAGRVSGRKHSEINRSLHTDEFRSAQAAVREAGLWRLDQRRPRSRSYNR